MNINFLPLPALVQANVHQSSRHIRSTWLRIEGVQLLPLCLAMLGWLTIAPTTGQAAESQQEPEAALTLVCTQQADHFICNPASNESPTSLRSSDLTATDLTATIAPQFFTPIEQSAISDVLLGLTYLLPIGLGLGIFLYDRYANYRTTLIKQQINALERIWQRSTTH